MPNRIDSGRCVACNAVLLWLDEPENRVINNMEAQLRNNLCSQCLDKVMRQQYQYFKKREKTKSFRKAHSDGKTAAVRGQVVKPIVVEHE